MNEPLKVLDHGFVRLVDHMGSDLSIVRAARVSYDAEWRAGEDAGKDAKLINYLMTHHHTSPFESVVFTFEVKAPIFVFRQWHRHRTWSYNEVSARYTELPDDMYFPKTVEKQSDSSKQGRGERISSEEFCLNTLRHVYSTCFQAYKELLDEGASREIARFVMPVATYSRMFATVDLHNLFHFLRLRLHPHAQYEIRVYAVAILQIIREVCPIATAAFERTLQQEFLS